MRAMKTCTFVRYNNVNENQHLLSSELSESNTPKRFISDAYMGYWSSVQYGSAMSWEWRVRLCYV